MQTTSTPFQIKYTGTLYMLLCIDGGLIFGLNRFYSPAGDTVVVITACLFLALPKVADCYIVIAIRTLHPSSSP